MKKVLMLINEQNNDARTIRSPSGTGDAIACNRVHRSKKSNNHSIRKNQNNKELDNNENHVEKCFFLFRTRYVITHIVIIIENGTPFFHSKARVANIFSRVT